MSKVRNLPELLSISDSDLIYAVESAINPNGGRKATIATLRSAILLASAVKTAYESNPDTNAFTDAEKTKLATVQANAAFQNAAQVPYDNSVSGLSAIQVNEAIDEVNIRAQADFRPSIVSGRILHYTGGTVRFDGVFYQLVANDILLNQNIANGEVYVDLDGVVKQTGSGVLAPPYTVVFAKFSTDLNDIISLTDERVKNAQNIIRGTLSDVRDVRAGAAASEGTSGRISDAMHKHNILTGPAVDTGDANTEGTSINLARADHKHNVPVANGIQNISGTLSLIYGNLANTVTQGNDSRLSTTNLIKVKQNPGFGEFSSIAAAVASITTASSSNPFVVSVGPGIFTEPQIVMKPYVFLEGTEQDKTVIQTNNTSQHAILGADNSGVSNCTIHGSLGSGFAAIYYESSAIYSRQAFFVRNVRFGNNDTLAICDSNLATTIMLIDSCVFGQQQFNRGFVAQGANACAIGVKNTTTWGGLVAPLPSDIFLASSSTSNFLLQSVAINTNGAGGNAIHLANGGGVRAVGCYFKGFSKGVWCENAGSAPSAVIAGTVFETNTLDIVIDHPGTTGSLDCVAITSKTTVNSSAPIKISLTDPDSSDTTGMFIKGDIFQADRFDRKANLSKIARTATTLGSVQTTNITYLSSVSGLTINVEEGSGFLNDPTDIYLKEVFWPSTDILLTANSNNYIYVDTNSVIQVNTSLPSLETVIPLGRVVTNGTGIRFIENSDLAMNHYGNKTESLLRYGFGPLFGIGSLISENATPLRLDATAGQYTFGVTPFLIAGGSAIVWESMYKNGSGGFTTVPSQNTVSNTQYDNGSGTLASIPAGKYASHTLFVIGDSGNEKWFLSYSQDVADTEAEAIQIPLPVVPTYISEAVVRVAHIIVQEGNPNIVSITDIRPRLGFAAPSQSAITIHSELSGLTADDHLQYLNRSGVRPMTGSLDMGANDITNVGLVDGVDVSSHASRHLPSGADPLATAIAVGLSPATVNAIGSANSFSRSDHTHSIATALVGDITTIQPDDSASAGTANTFARGDHRHAIVAAAASTQIPDQANSEGSSTSFARADHGHQLVTAAPLTTLSPAVSNAQGSATSFSRSDHTHAIATALVGDITTIQPDDSASAGTANTFARGDHRHAIATAAAVSVSTATTNTEGASTNFARADHTHAVSVPNSEATATADDTTVSVTDVLIVGMTLTPAAGTYLVNFSTSVVNSGNGSSRLFVSLYSGGTQVTHTERNIGISGGSNVPVHSQAIVTVNGSQAIEARWRAVAGTNTAHQRSLNVIKLS